MQLTVNEQQLRILTLALTDYAANLDKPLGADLSKQQTSAIQSEKTEVASLQQQISKLGIDIASSQKLLRQEEFMTPASEKV